VLIDPISRHVRKIVHSICKENNISYERLAELLSIPTMTLRRYCYSTFIHVQGERQKIKNEHHRDISLRRYLQLWVHTNKDEIPGYVAHYCNGIFISGTGSSQPTQSALMDSIRQIADISEEISINCGEIDELTRTRFFELAETFHQYATWKNNNTTGGFINDI
jgi:hypothetical protein